MTPSGTRRWRGRRLRRCWMGSKLFIGYMRQLRRDPPLKVPLARGSSNLHLGAGYGRSRAAAQGGRHQGPPESEGPQEGLAVPSGLTEKKMVGEQGRHIWHGQCPIPTGDAWQPFCSGSSTHFSLKWIGTSSLSMTSCGCFEARGP